MKVVRYPKRVLTLLFALLLPALMDRMPSPAVAMGSPRPTDEVPLTRDILRVGQKLLLGSLGRLPGLGMGGLISVNIHGGTLINFGGPDTGAVADLDRRLKELESRRDGQSNPELVKFLDALQQQIKILKEQFETQNKTLTLMRERFTYDTEAVMRKPLYRFPDDGLVVIVGDFSSGNPDEGREIADEIAVNLAELVRETGIACHILVGETKPGLIIRSEQMARDAGLSLPVNTEYVVIWGTMSPRTVGKYRPHITSCWKQGDKSGVGIGLDLPIEASDLPLSGDSQARSREAFRRLIGVTCAAIPSIYAAHEINRERTPDLKKYYDYLGGESEEVKSLKAEIGPLSRWSNDRSEWSRRYASLNKGLRRISGISVDQPYPKTIYNEKDGSVLALISDPNGKPIKFNDEKQGEYVCYIDVMEASNDQFLMFLNSDESNGGHRENRKVGGLPWIDLTTDFADIEEREGLFFLKLPNERYARNSVIGVTWFAARDYCTWAGKELPTQKEWELAAERENHPQFPWGNEITKPEGPLKAWNTTMPCGLNTTDRSRIGCYDMRGNVTEWCADLVSSNAEFAARGGGFDDKTPESFDIKLSRKFPQASHNRSVGFRGVIRFPVVK